MKELIECRLIKEQLRILEKTFCAYENGTKTGEIPVDCDECILRDIKWSPCMADVYENDWFGNSHVTHKKPIIRDLCFAIYHDKILTKKPKHYHHDF